MSEENTSNTNCLEGIQCPTCQSTEPFWIECTVSVRVFDDGTDNYEGYEWDDDSPIRCEACDASATVGLFRRGHAPVTPEEYVREGALGDEEEDN